MAGVTSCVFLTFEGPEGAGKSTLVRRLAGRLEELGLSAVVTREPGSGEFGKAVRDLLLHSGACGPWAESFLFLADRSNHMETVVEPALSVGSVVLCDRHADSTVVYQGYARGLDVDTLRQMNAIATKGCVPHRTFLLDLPVALGLSRSASRDRMESEPEAFHQKVRDGFLAEAAREPARWVVLDASLPEDDVFGQAWESVRQLVRLRPEVRP